MSLTLRDAVVQSLTSSDLVRVLESGGVKLASSSAFDVEIANQRAMQLDATFDPSATLGYVGSRINQPPSSFFGPGIPAGTRRDEGNLTAGISKTWEAGTVTSLSYNPPLSYLFFPSGSSAAFNPAYESTLSFDIRQPLWKGAGIETNLAPIRIAHLRADQTTWQIKEATIDQIRSVEEAYWQLQAAVVAQQAVDAIVPLAEEVVRIQRVRFENQYITAADLARAEAQLKEFQKRRIRTELAIRTAEIRLKNMLGLSIDYNVSLIPVDQPLQELAPLDLDQSVGLASAYRPDLVQKRLDVEVRTQEMLVAENGVRPRLDVFAQYRTSGLSDRLDDSLNQAFSFGYTDWTLGTSFAMPIGNRAPRAARDEAALRVARERAILNQMEINVRYQLAESMMTIDAIWEQYQLAKQRAAETLKWVEISRVRFAYPPPADNTNQDWLTVLLVDYQQALQTHLEAVGDTAGLLADYNTQHARLEAAQGTLLMRRQVWLDGEMPVMASQSAAQPSGQRRLSGYSMP